MYGPVRERNVLFWSPEREGKGWREVSESESGKKRTLPKDEGTGSSRLLVRCRKTEIPGTLWMVLESWRGEWILQVR